MKYIVIGNQTIMPTSHTELAGVLQSAADWIDQKLADGTLEAAYSFPAGGGLLIFNAGSHEELMELLMDFPPRPLSDFEILDAIDYRTATKMVIDRIKRLD